MQVTDQFINGLMNMICYIPIVCGVIALVAMSFYSLTDEKVEKISNFRLRTCMRKTKKIYKIKVLNQDLA
jgi:Na+/melibiose symporter-like transporter